MIVLTECLVQIYPYSAANTLHHNLFLLYDLKEVLIHRMDLKEIISDLTLINIFL